MFGDITVGDLEGDAAQFVLVQDGNDCDVDGAAARAVEPDRPDDAALPPADDAWRQVQYTPSEPAPDSDSPHSPHRPGSPRTPRGAPIQSSLSFCSTVLGCCRPSQATHSAVMLSPLLSTSLQNPSLSLTHLHHPSRSLTLLD